ncbi:hypothetical protein KM043_003823 [Ampulex compressa]|nr:hypothetical protein KM043_003823 [Ampulex compressa]
MRNATGLYARRRQRVVNGGIAKQHRLELRRLEESDLPSSLGTPMSPPESPAWDRGCPDEFASPALINPSLPRVSGRLPPDMEDHWKVFLVRKEGLLDIVVRTMALVRRNHILQARVNALRAETRDFIRSVLNNPENKRRQERSESGGRKDAVVSSSTDNSVSRLLFPPTPDSTSPSASASASSSSASSSDADDDDDGSSICYSTDWDSEGSRSSYYDN